MVNKKIRFTILLVSFCSLILSSNFIPPILYSNDFQINRKQANIPIGISPFLPAAEEIGFMEYGKYDGDGGRSSGVAIQGDLVFVANGNQGLEIIDVSDPYYPIKISSIVTQGDAVDVFLYGNIAFVSQSYYGVALINVSDPVNPVLESTIIPGGAVQEVAIHAHILRLATVSNGVHFYEVSDPSAPLFISSWKGGNQIEGVATITKYVCLAVENGGLEIVDLTFPADPYLVGSWNDSIGVAYGVDTIAINDFKYAFLAYGQSGLAIINFSNPKLPEKIGEYSYNSVVEVTVVNNLAFLSCKNHGMVILDISDLTNPVEVSVYDTPGFCLDTVSSGNLAVIADDEDGIQILSIATPSNPILLSKFLGFGRATRVIIRDDLAYVLDYYKGLEIYDLSDPSMPYKIGSFDNDHDDDLYTFDLTLSGDLAIISAFEDGILFVDISDPYNPELLGSYFDGNRIHCTEIQGDIVFAAGLNRTMLALNISDIENISIEGTFEFATTFPYIYSMLLEDSILYVGTTFLGIFSFNISDLTAITQNNNLAEDNSYREMIKRDDILFAAAGNGGFQIFNTSDNTIVSISETNTDGYSYEISLFGNLLFVADGYYGLKVFNISDLTTPVLAGEFTKYKFYGVKHYEQYIVGGIGYDGVVVLALDSDQDSITDIDEITIYGTNPYSSDTDNDGAADGFEILYGLDPLDASDGEEDPDEDGLTNAEESEVSTHPLEADTDFDGMPDGYEVENRLDPLLDDSGEDEDGDTLTNLEEYIIGTDPRNDDTDRDDFEDGLEIIYGTDPFNARDNPQSRKIKRIIATASIGAVLLGAGFYLIVRIVKKRIFRNREREQQLLQEEQEKILIF